MSPNLTKTGPALGPADAVIMTAPAPEASRTNRENGPAEVGTTAGHEGCDKRCYGDTRPGMSETG